MNNDKISETAIELSMSDRRYFEKLSVANMLRVMIRDIAFNGSIMKNNLDIWNSLESKERQMTQQEKLEQVMEVLSMERPARVLKIMEQTGLLEFCLPLCFPIEQPNGQEFRRALDRADRCNGDIPLKMAELFSIFAIEKTRETFKRGKLDTETARWICRRIGGNE